MSAGWEFTRGAAVRGTGSFCSPYSNPGHNPAAEFSLLSSHGEAEGAVNLEHKLSPALITAHRDPCGEVLE